MLSFEKVRVRYLRKSGPVVRVLNGDFPEEVVKRMNVSRLKNFVNKLVECTSTLVGVGAEPSWQKPKWWPREIVSPIKINKKFTSRQNKATLTRLVNSCSNFFRRFSNKKSKYLNEWNDENRRRGVKRLRSSNLVDSPPRKRPRTPLPSIIREPYVLLNDAVKKRTSRPIAKNEFLQYFQLERARNGAVAKPEHIVQGGAKFASCSHIPFSSDVGRLMASREHHSIPDDLKFRRLEKNEWYVNKKIAKIPSIEYETITSKKLRYSHTYKMPKRQLHQKTISVHNVEFLLQFCRPLVVNLERLDLEKIVPKRRKEVLVRTRGTSEEAPVLRYSPRFQKF